MSEPYFLLNRSPGVVELWSTVRLPFEPRGWLREMRTALREALHDLSNQTSSGRLHALYCAADEGSLVDIDNILICNVEAPAFSSLTRNSLRIERGYRVPPPPSEANLDSHTLHYHRYTEGGDNPDGLWRTGRLLGQFTDVAVHVVDKPAPVWKAIREQVEPPDRIASRPAKFLIHVEVTDTWPNSAGSVAGIIKPVLDGIISAYHSHGDAAGVPDDPRLAGLGLGTAKEIREMLLDPQWAALGPRRQLLKPHGVSGVQWNPADDYCVSAHVTRTAGEHITADHPARWRLTSKLTAATGDSAQ